MIPPPQILLSQWVRPMNSKRIGSPRLIVSVISSVLFLSAIVANADSTAIEPIDLTLSSDLSLDLTLDPIAIGSEFDFEENDRDSSDLFSGEQQTVQVPEPSAISIFAIGSIAGLAIYFRRAS